MKNCRRAAKITIRIQLDALGRGDQAFIKTAVFEGIDEDTEPAQLTFD